MSVSDITSSIQCNDDDVIQSHTSLWSQDKKNEYSEYISQQHISYENVIHSGDRIVFESNKIPSTIFVRENTDIRVRNQRVCIGSMLGEPFNSTFAIENKQVKRRLDGKIDIEDIFARLHDKDLMAPDFIPTTNNKDLVGRQCNQKLTQNDIEELKNDNTLTSTDIMKIVTSSSSTFHNKTEFSQLKWYKKKHQKYNTDIHVYAPTPSHIIECERSRDNNTILNMRDDTLAQIITLCSIGADSRTIIVDGTNGLITGTVLRKQGGYGAVLHIHTSPKQRHLQFVTDMNVTKHEKRNLCSMQYDCLPSYGQRDTYHNIQLEKQYEYEQQQQQQQQQQNKPFVYMPTMSDLAENFLMHKGTSIIIASHYDPLSLLLPLLPYVLPSSPFVLYSQTIEPLSYAHEYLLYNGLVSYVALQETWYRPIQVLPNRTHPHMSMDATGGYLLYGYISEKATLSGGLTTATADTTTSLLHPQHQDSNNALNFTPIVKVDQPLPRNYNTNNTTQETQEIPSESTLDTTTTTTTSQTNIDTNTTEK